jgi:hypothetical protein
MDGNDRSHHKRFEYCKTRPKYRAGKNLTAVKVRFSVTTSQPNHISNVLTNIYSYFQGLHGGQRVQAPPHLRCSQSQPWRRVKTVNFQFWRAQIYQNRYWHSVVWMWIRLFCTRFGFEINNFSWFSVELEPFTDCFHAEFAKSECARKCKKFLDAKSFYGGVLHISYAPELESVVDVREKLLKRRAEVDYRLRRNKTKRPNEATGDGQDPKKPKRWRRKIWID